MSTKFLNQMGTKKTSLDGVQIVNCIETLTLEASHKCSHSGQNAIHLDIDRVIQFISDRKK